MSLLRCFTRVKPPIRPICQRIMTRNQSSQEIASNRAPTRQPENGVQDNPDQTGGPLIPKKKNQGVEDEYGSLFPILKDLNPTTEERVFSLSVSCDKIRTLIARGLITKPLTLQYCHYLAELLRSGEVDSDIDYHNKNLIVVFNYLMRAKNEMPPQSKFVLITDVADATQHTCSNICDNIILKDEELVKSMADKHLSSIFSSCIRFGDWSTAGLILDKYSHLKLISAYTADRLVEGLQKSSRAYLELSNDPEGRESLRASILTILERIFQISQRDAVQFIVKTDTSTVIEALKKLDIEVKVNTRFKLSGRCLNCNAHLPLYSHESVRPAHEIIKKILTTKMRDLQVYSTTKELEDFFEFLESMYSKDRKPLDVVIDGLNCAYKRFPGSYHITKKSLMDLEITEKRFTKESLSQVLINTMIRFGLTEQNKKVLLIGRRHMKGWPGLIEFLKKSNINYYFTDNKSVDDLFALFAATRNPKTLIVSGDYYRDFLAHNMGEDEGRTISRWLDVHQASPDYRLEPLWPTPYETLPSFDRDHGCFHIPIIDYFKLNTSNNHEPPPALNSKIMTWTCCVFDKNRVIAGQDVKR